MKKTGIKYILLMEPQEQEVTVEGWVRTKRESKGLSFLEINDGSAIKNVQVVIDENFPDYETIARFPSFLDRQYQPPRKLIPYCRQSENLKQIFLKIPVLF